MTDVMASESNASISAGRDHTLALKSDGSLWAWGSNDSGQLGDGTTDSRKSPVRVGEDNNWAAVSAGGYHTLALKSDLSLWAWGRNGDGQLGNGANINRNTPVRAGEDDDWVAISAGGYHSLAKKFDGSLWTWGNNNAGQLGDGTYGRRETPEMLGNDYDWNIISAGDSHTLAIKNDGSLWAWGSNSFGQLGDGSDTTKNQNMPVRIGEDNDWVDISAGGWHSLALKGSPPNLSLWAWGWNSYGQLGDGTNENSNIPIPVEIGVSWAAISTGDSHSMALKNDGTLWAWGRNDSGQLGDGTNEDNNAPVQVGDTNWGTVSAGGYHTLALKNDGTLWAWGYNENGQLGNGTNANVNSSVQVGSDADWGTGSPYISIFIAVTNISGVPASAIVGTPLPLTGVVSPPNATNKSIAWSVIDDPDATGATISSGIFNAMTEGTVTIRATIVNGSAEGVNYVQDFNITVNAATVNPITGDPKLVGIGICTELICSAFNNEGITGDGNGNFFKTLVDYDTIYSVEYIIENVPSGTDPIVEIERDGAILLLDTTSEAGPAGLYFSNAEVTFNHGDKIIYRLYVGGERVGSFTVVYVNSAEYVVHIPLTQTLLAGNYYLAPLGLYGPGYKHEIISRPVTLGGTAAWITTLGQIAFARQTIPANMSLEGVYIVRVVNSGNVFAIYIITVS